MLDAVMLKKLIAFLLLSPPLIILILKIFRLQSELAGVGFILIGVILFVQLSKIPNFRSSLLFWVSSFYLFVSILLYGGTLSHWGTIITDYTFMGVPASNVHLMSVISYFIIIFMMIIYVLRINRAKK